MGVGQWLTKKLGGTLAADGDTVVWNAATKRAEWGAGGGGLTPAGTFTVENQLDPIVDDDETTMAVIVVPADQAVLAIKKEGDDHPRWLIPTDPGYGFYFGDGTVDPYSEGVSFWVGSAVGGWEMFFVGNGSSNLMKTSFGGDVEAGEAFNDGSKGLILTSPNGTRYRVKVANGGALSAEALA